MPWKSRNRSKRSLRLEDVLLAITVLVLVVLAVVAVLENTVWGRILLIVIQFFICGTFTKSLSKENKIQ